MSAGSPHARMERWLGTYADSLPAGAYAELVALWRDTTALIATPPASQRMAQGEDKPVAWWNGIQEDKLERSPYGPSIRWGADAENDGHDIPLYAGMNPIHYTTQPPHQDRGEVEWQAIKLLAAACCVSPAVIECNAATDDVSMRIALRAITAALTEAKQQGPGEAVGTIMSVPADDDYMGQPMIGWHRTVPPVGTKLYTAPQIEAKQQGPGGVLARGWFHALPEDDYEFHDDASGAGKNCPGCIRAMIVREAPQVEAKRQTGGDA